MSDPFVQDQIYFDEDSHAYFVKETGRRLTSPTSIIKQYSHPFDPDGTILKRCATREGVPPEELHAKWRKMGDDSVVRGHSIHDSFEKYVLTGKIQDDENQDIIIDFASKVKTEGALYPEVTLFDLEYGMAGRTDLVEMWWDNIINLYDFKTNKKISKFSFGKKMFPPLDHIWDCNFYHYECQLSLYALMLESQGYCPRNLNLLWINPKRKIEIIPMQYRRNDMLLLLKHYHYEKEKQ